MLVAGDHANNDMAGGMQDGEQPDADSFAGKLQAAGYQPECVIRGIGEYPAVREVYLTHLRQITQKLFCDLRTKNRPGILYGIGVESGNPKLMTLQALETIRSCDLIVLPAVSKRGMLCVSDRGAGLSGNCRYAASLYAISDDQRCAETGTGTQTDL